LQIKQNLSSAYHPQTDGLAEQTNQWVEQYLRIFGNELQNDWAEHLPMAQFVHNSWPHKVTKRSPFELLIGANPRTVILTPTHKVHTLEERQSALEKTCWLAQKAMIQVQNLMRLTKGKRTFIPYTLHQKVWLEATNLKTMHPTTKLVPRQYGPFQVKQVISPVIYQLEIPKHWKIHDVFHTSLLIPYVKTEIHGPNYEEPPPELIDQQPEWEVQSILDSQRFGRTKTLQYWVRWKGYSAAHDSWEPATNVHAPALVKDYYKAKGTSAVKVISPPVRIQNITMTSPESSTPSYVHKIEAQFNAQPLPDFQLLDVPDTFELAITYQAQEQDSPEPLTPPPISISPDVHKLLLDQMAQDTICEDTPINDHPGEGWELAHLAVHNHCVLVHDSETNMS